MWVGLGFQVSDSRSCETSLGATELEEQRDRVQARREALESPGMKL